MLFSAAVFTSVLWALFLMSRAVPLLNEMTAYVGWLTVVVYSAFVLTKWALNNLPRQQVSPHKKAVLITGCDSGFGNKLVRRLDKEGFSVFAGCLVPDGEGAKNLARDCSERMHVLALDVTREEQVQAAVKEVEANLGDNDLWAVVNNAGVGIFSELEWCSMATIDCIFEVNVLGAVRVTKAFLPLLRTSRGRVVVVSSVAGHFTYPGFVTYSMTKHALVAFADGLRREACKWGVKVSRIEPSLYRTQISAPEVLSAALDKSWESTSTEVREAYGEGYFVAFKLRMQKLLQSARPHLWEVVDCMEKAIREQNPKIVYRCGGPVDKIRLWVMAVIPTTMLDLLMCLVVQPRNLVPVANGHHKQL